MALVLHPYTERAVDDYVSRPAGALLITGPGGSGKATIARQIVATVLQIDTSNDSAYDNHPYIRTIRSEDHKAIPIDSIRELRHFLSLSIPNSRPQAIDRVTVVEDAHLLTVEAQNALLKTLEEPPVGTIIILTATSSDSVLPTIQSRVRELSVLPPRPDVLAAHFQSLGYSREATQRALMLSGELPGLASALLAEDANHPLVAATTHARGILQSKTYERLLLVDSLSKQKALCVDILYVLGQMSRTALLRSASGAAAERWQRILRATFAASEQLNSNTQTKLVLTNLMLEL